MLALGVRKVWNSGRNYIIWSYPLTCVSKTRSEKDTDVPVDEDQGYNYSDGNGALQDVSPITKKLLIQTAKMNSVCG